MIASKNDHTEGLELIDEMERFDCVRNGGCTLKREGDTYRMSYDRNVAKKAELYVGATPPERLAAHWRGFIRAMK